MLAGAHLAGVDLKEAAGHGRVVQQAEGVVAVGDEAVEVGLLRQAHADGDGAHDGLVEAGEVGEEGGHGLPEPRELADCLVVVVVVVVLARPAVGVARLVLAADLEGFFDVGDGGAQGGHGGRGGELADFLAAWGGVAAVGFRGGPGEGVLGGGGEAEELGGAGEGFGDGGGGDGEVGEVDEAGGLEAG